jgi:hypothetical protein
VSTRVMGTYGYAAPEYVMTGKISMIWKFQIYKVVIAVTHAYAFLCSWRLFGMMLIVLLISHIYDFSPIWIKNLIKHL